MSSIVWHSNLSLALLLPTCVTILYPLVVVGGLHINLLSPHAVLQLVKCMVINNQITTKLKLVPFLSLACEFGTTILTHLNKQISTDSLRKPSDFLFKEIFCCFNTACNLMHNKL